MLHFIKLHSYNPKYPLVKKLLSFFFVLSTTMLSAKRTGPGSCLNLIYGRQISIQSFPSHSFELSFDSRNFSCIRNTRPPFDFYGFGLMYNHNTQFQEFGIFTRFNPTRYGLSITRKIKLEPYLFIQGNYLQKIDFNVVYWQYNYRPGIGFVTHTRTSNSLAIIGTCQVGYTMSKEPLKPNAWIIEVKLGIGLNPRRLRAKKRSKNLESNSINVYLL